MAKKVNKKLVVGVTTFGFLVGTALCVIMLKTLQQTDPTHYVEQARSCAAAQDWIQAKNYYMRAYGISKDAGHWAAAGQMLYEGGDELTAERYWNEALTVDPTLIEAHEKIIDLRTEIARMYNSPAAWRRVQERAAALLEVDQENAKGRYGLGLALMELADDELDANVKEELQNEGMSHIKRAAELAPEVVDYSLALATYAHRAGRVDETEEILKELTESHQTPGEQAARVRYTYARLLSTLDRHDEAVKFYEEAEGLAGEDPEARATAKSQYAQYWVTRWYALAGPSADSDEARAYYDKARRLLEESIDIDPSAFLPYMLLAELHSFRGNHSQAIEICERRIERSIRREGIHVAQRKFSLYMLLLKAAEECLVHAETLDGKSAEYDQMVSKADAFAKDAAAEFTDRGPGLYTMGRIKFAQGDELGAIEMFQRAATAYGGPSWRNSRMLAVLLLRNRQPGAAKAAIQDALRDPAADPACRVTQAEILLQTGELEDAIRAAEQALRRMPGNKEAARIQVAALTRLGETGQAERIRKRYLADAPRDRTLRANILYREGKLEQAVLVFEDLLANSPAHLAYLRPAVRILVQLDRYDRAAELVSQARQAAPQDIRIRLMELDTKRDLSVEERGQARFEILDGIDDSFRRHFELALWYQSRDMDDEYAKHLDEAERFLDHQDTALDRGERRKYLRDILERQFVLAATTKDLQRVEQYVDKAVKANIDGADGLTYRGRAHMIQGAPDLALNSFKAALEKQPTNASTLTWLGQCHVSLDPPQVLEAQTYFTQAAEANPNMGAAQKGLAKIAHYLGDNDEFVRRLGECARLMPNDPWVKEQLVAEREKSAPLEGIKRRLVIREDQPDSVENLVMLAELYVRTKQYDQAAECFEAALALPGTDMTTVVAAAAFFRGTGQADRALEVIQQQIARTEDDTKKAYYVLLAADHWNELGDLEKAEAALKRAAEYGETLQVCSAFAVFHADNRNYPAALEWCDRTIQLAEQQSPELGARFRRNRIDILLKSADYDGAQREIQSFLRLYPDNQAGLLLRTAAQTLRGDIDQAVQSLTHYLDEHPDSKHALLQRGRLYASQGRRGLAIKDLEKLRGLDSGYRNYQPRILLADAYALNNRPDLAFAELESIVRSDPAARNVAQHLIELYRERERYGDATRVCTSMANRYPDEPMWMKHRGDIKVTMGDTRAALGDYEIAAELSEADPRFTPWVLKSYGDLGLLQEGIQYYRRNIPPDKRTPGVMLRFAELVGMSGQTDQAVETFLEAFDAGDYGDIRLVRDLGSAIIASCGGEQAIDLFRVQRDDPRLNRAAQHILGVLFTRFRRSSEALDTLEGLLQTAADDSEKTMLLAAIGNIHEFQENWEQAGQTYQELLRIDNRHLIGLNNLAYLLSDKLGRPADAIPYAKQAVRLSGAANVHDTLAWTYVQLGQYRKAVATLITVLEENPRFIVAIYHLAEAYRRNGELTKAGEVLGGAENLLAEGLGLAYADRIRKCRADISGGNTSP